MSEDVLVIRLFPKSSLKKMVVGICERESDLLNSMCFYFHLHLCFSHAMEFDYDGIFDIEMLPNFQRTIQIASRQRTSTLRFCTLPSISTDKTGEITGRHQKCQEEGSYFVCCQGG